MTRSRPISAVLLAVLLSMVPVSEASAQNRPPPPQPAAPQPKPAVSQPKPAAQPAATPRPRASAPSSMRPRPAGVRNGTAHRGFLKNSFNRNAPRDTAVQNFNRNAAVPKSAKAVRGKQLVRQWNAAGPRPAAISNRPSGLRNGGSPRGVLKSAFNHKATLHGATRTAFNQQSLAAASSQARGLRLVHAHAKQPRAVASLGSGLSLAQWQKLKPSLDGRGGKNQTSSIARHYEKHTNWRSKDRGLRAAWLWGGKASGSPQNKHRQAMQQFRQIVNSKGQWNMVRTNQNQVFLEKRLADGRGVRLNRDYTFKGFVD